MPSEFKQETMNGFEVCPPMKRQRDSCNDLLMEDSSNSDGSFQGPNSGGEGRYSMRSKYKCGLCGQVRHRCCHGNDLFELLELLLTMVHCARPENRDFFRSWSPMLLETFSVAPRLLLSRLWRTLLASFHACM